MYLLWSGFTSTPSGQKTNCYQAAEQTRLQDVAVYLTLMHLFKEKKPRKCFVLPLLSVKLSFYPKLFIIRLRIRVSIYGRFQNAV